MDLGCLTVLVVTVVPVETIRNRGKDCDGHENSNAFSMVNKCLDFESILRQAAVKSVFPRKIFGGKTHFYFKIQIFAVGIFEIYSRFDFMTI